MARHSVADNPETTIPEWRAMARTHLATLTPLSPVAEAFRDITCPYSRYAPLACVDNSAAGLFRNVEVQQADGSKYQWIPRCALCVWLAFFVSPRGTGVFRRFWSSSYPIASPPFTNPPRWIGKPDFPRFTV